MDERIVIERRFRGPPDSGNGGYSCGLLGVLMPGPSEVTLRVPPPLDTMLKVEKRMDGLAAVHDGTVVIEAFPSELDVSLPGSVSLEDAERAASRYEGFHNHDFPGCFVCGPERDVGDGLRIFPGELEGGGAASPWIPDDSVAHSSGVVHPEIVWAALDCPTGWAAHYAAPSGALALLGRLAARILRPVRVGEPYVAVAWPAGREGRKHRATCAVLGTDGEPYAVGRATWVELRG